MGLTKLQMGLVLKLLQNFYMEIMVMNLMAGRMLAIKDILKLGIVVVNYYKLSKDNNLVNLGCSSMSSCKEKNELHTRRMSRKLVRLKSNE